MVFERANGVTSQVQRMAKLVVGIDELKLEVGIGGLFPRQAKIEREGFPKMFEALARLTRVQHPVADFLVAAGEVASSLRVIWVHSDERFANLERLRVTLQCSG